MFVTTGPVIDWVGQYVPPETKVDTTDWPQDYIDCLVEDGVVVEYPDPVEPTPTPTDVGSTAPAPDPTPVAVVDVGGDAARPQHPVHPVHPTQGAS